MCLVSKGMPIPLSPTNAGFSSWSHIVPVEKRTKSFRREIRVDDQWGCRGVKETPVNPRWGVHGWLPFFFIICLSGTKAAIDLLFFSSTKTDWQSLSVVTIEGLLKSTLADLVLLFYIFSETSTDITVCVCVFLLLQYWCHDDYFLSS